jgi:hypothetical protein
MNTNNIPNNGNYFYSDPLPLSIPFVKHNNYRVFWDSTGDLMNTLQANYLISNIPINYWSLAAKVATNNNVSNDSACFIIMYISTYIHWIGVHSYSSSSGSY